MAADIDVKQRFFPHTQDELKEIASDILRYAKELGASDAATEISEGDGLSVSVRRGEVETIEHNRDKMVGVTVFIGKKRGNASTAVRFQDPAQRTNFGGTTEPQWGTPNLAQLPAGAKANTNVA